MKLSTTSIRLEHCISIEYLKLFIAIVDFHIWSKKYKTTASKSRTQWILSINSWIVDKYIVAIAACRFTDKIHVDFQFSFQKTTKDGFKRTLSVHIRCCEAHNKRPYKWNEVIVHSYMYNANKFVFCCFLEFSSLNLRKSKPTQYAKMCVW